jgi:hypothetical protein
MAWKIPVRVATLRSETGWTRHERAPRTQHPEVHCSQCWDGQRTPIVAESDHVA